MQSKIFSHPQLTHKSRLSLDQNSANTTQKGQPLIRDKLCISACNCSSCLFASSGRWPSSTTDRNDPALQQKETTSHLVCTQLTTQALFQSGYRASDSSNHLRFQSAQAPLPLVETDQLNIVGGHIRSTLLSHSTHKTEAFGLSRRGDYLERGFQKRLEVDTLSSFQCIAYESQ